MVTPGAPASKDFLGGNWKTVISSPGAGDGDYVPLPLHNLTAGQEVPCDVMVKVRLGRNNREVFKTCCPQGQRFEPVWLEKLQQAGISRVYIHRQDQPLVFHYLNQNLAVMLDDGSLPVKAKAERVVDVTYFWMNQFFSNTQIQVMEHLKQGFEYVDHLLTFVRQDHYHQLWLIDLYRYDQTLYSHCLNTCLLSMAFAKYLGWEERKIRDLGRGALLHDIGMTRVPKDILNKKGGLTADEWEVVKKHPFSGFVMLKTFSLMSREALFLVLQHHENGDGSGYPEGLKMNKIHPLARLVRIVDSFEALVSPRSWRPEVAPAQALRIMRQDWQRSGMFDVCLLAQFIKFIAGERN